MPPRVPAFTAAKALPLRPRSQPHQVRQWQSRLRTVPASTSRCYSDSSKDLPKSQDGKGPNTEQLPHSSEEAAATAEIIGKEGPDLSQGTPVEEIVKGDKQAEKNLPKVMQDELKNTPSGKRSFSILARRHMSTTSPRQQNVTPNNFSSSAWPPPSMFSGPPDPNPFGLSPNHQVDLPGAFVAKKPPVPAEIEVEVAEPESRQHKRRYQPIVEQMVGLMIRHGNKAAAQRNMMYILAHLRTAPPPNPLETATLVHYSPPPAELPLDPTLYFEVAIESIAPLFRLVSMRGMAGGGAALQLPAPLTQRQRRRTAMKWILDAASAKRNRGSGKNAFAQRVAEEIVAVVEGKSGVWERRTALHKMGVSARANVQVVARARRGRR